MELKILAKPLGISKIEAGAKGGRIEFTANPNINPKQVIHLIQSHPQQYRLEGPTRLKFTQDLSDVQQRFAAIQALLKILI